MSENSSDSDSSSGWTIISHEGSDAEMVTPVTGAEGCELSPELASLGQEELPQQEESSQDSMTLTGEAEDTAFETEEEKSPGDHVYFGTASDDSDIVTLELPKLEELGSQDIMIAEEACTVESFSLGSSSSSQYTFCQPEVEEAGWWEKLWKIAACVRAWDAHQRRSAALQGFSSQHSDSGSSSEEAADQPSPTLRRRRARKKAMLETEWEEQDPEPLVVSKRQYSCSGSLSKCVALALVVAVSMGFGHFYGTIQRQQQLVQNTPENAASDVMSYLVQHPREQEPLLDTKHLKESLRRCRLLAAAGKMSLEIQKRLTTQNHHLRVSLEQRESALGSLQEELEKLREQIRTMEEKSTSAELTRDNEKLKLQLEDAKEKTQRFLNQREILLAETHMLQSELETEPKVGASLQMEIAQLQPGQWQAKPGSPQDKELAVLRERVVELEQKLNFEQQRSDLWERLYIKARDQTGEQKGSRGHHRVKSKSKETFLGTVKETFDAMKNSTKEFVRHHKEKIKQAKEAVKENLKKFSESVKSTFRHFKDTTKTIFDEKGNRKFGATKKPATTKKTPVFSDCSHSQYKGPSPNQKHRGHSMQRDPSRRQPARWQEARNTAQVSRDGVAHDWQGDCRDYRGAGEHVFGRAQQEPFSPCNMVVNSALVGEFRQVIRRYLLKELGAFHHWEELNEFINQFIINGLYTNNQKIFADFVNEVKEYLKSMKEYQVDTGVFEKLNGYICRHFATGSPAPHGPSRPDKKQPMVNTGNARHRNGQKHLQPQPCKGKVNGVVNTVL
ncbi:cell cycle progression protein 1 isoform X2 [Cavia porcellus]|nr:cell cycle progression protein 1 isoform X2 [Cavia porcellus]